MCCRDIIGVVTTAAGLAAQVQLRKTFGLKPNMYHGRNEMRLFISIRTFSKRSTMRPASLVGVLSVSWSSLRAGGGAGKLSGDPMSIPGPGKLASQGGGHWRSHCPATAASCWDTRELFRGTE